MAERRVRTPAGAEFYGLPIGSIITADGPDVGFDGKRPLTFARLLSIRQMLAAAQAVGDQSQVKHYQGMLWSELGRMGNGDALKSAVADALHVLSKNNDEYKDLTSKTSVPKAAPFED